MPHLVCIMVMQQISRAGRLHTLTETIFWLNSFNKVIMLSICTLVTETQLLLNPSFSSGGIVFTQSSFT